MQDKVIRIGADMKENWDLIDESEGDDLWFHLDGVPSAHVFLSYPKNRKIMRVDDYSEGDVLACAQLCKSKAKKEYRQRNRIRVVYTVVSNLNKRGCSTGSVRIRDESLCRYIDV